MDEDLEIALAISRSLDETERNRSYDQPSSLVSNFPTFSEHDDFLIAKSLQENDLKNAQSAKDMAQADFELALKINQMRLDDELMNSSSSIATNDDQSKSNTDTKVMSNSNPRSIPSLLSPLMSDSICPGCNLPIQFQEPHLTLKERKYHRSCCRCTACGECIEGNVVRLPSSPALYHPDCYDAFCRPRCCLCKSFLPNQYIRCNEILEPHEVGYCPTHSSSSKQCYACQRLEPHPSADRDAFTTLTDGRSLCPDCMRTAVWDSEEARPLYLAAVDFMERELCLQLPPGMRDVPILAVDSLVINQQMGETTNKSSHGIPEAQKTASLRGLTVSTVGEVRHYSPGGVYWDPRVRALSEAPPTLVRLEPVRNVSAVLVLFCLPRELTASILAHEAMHVWLRLRTDVPTKLPPAVEEGLCQLVACKYLLSVQQKHTTTVSQDNEQERIWDERLRAYCVRLIETDPTEVYGEGFRNAATCCNELGLEILLEHVCQAAQFPVVR